MAELTKKLHFKKNTTEHMAKAYSTTAEAGAEYITNKIDGVTAYVPIGATNDSRATVGRVKKSGGTEKAILTMGKPPYTEKSWTTAGTYTFTVPAGVTRIRIAVCGGGGGGASNYIFSNPKQVGGTGGTSKFDTLIQATGGTGGQSKMETDYEGSEWGVQTGGTGGTPKGKNGKAYGGRVYDAGTVGWGIGFTASTGNYGNGGGVDTRASSGSNTSGATGGTGGYNTGYVNVTPNQTYQIIVGRGGSLANDYPSKSKAYNGTSGFVLIAYGGDV